MKKKNEVEEMYARFTQAAHHADSTLRTVETYSAIKALRWVLGVDGSENNLEEIVEAIESAPASR